MKIKKMADIPVAQGTPSDSAGVIVNFSGTDAGGTVQLGNLIDDVALHIINLYYGL